MILYCWLPGWLLAQRPSTVGLGGAVGFELPIEGQWSAAKHFPQASVGKEFKQAAGLRLAAFPDVPGFHLSQAGYLRRWKVYHAAAYADFFGDALFGWQHFHLAAGLPLGKVQFGIGAAHYRWWVSDVKNYQWQAKIGFSGFIKEQWKWHLGIQTPARQPSTADKIAGAPPARAFFAVNHVLGPLELWTTYQQQAGLAADFGLAALWKLNSAFQIDIATSPRNRRLSIGISWTYQKLHWHLQARWQNLPGLWYDNSLIWRDKHGP